jgi:hypothetical protein
VTTYCQGVRLAACRHARHTRAKIMAVGQSTCASTLSSTSGASSTAASSGIARLCHAWWEQLWVCL